MSDIDKHYLRMRSYKKENLQQCVKNLFAQARYEFKKWKLKIALGEGVTEFKVISFWDNEDDCFYAMALELDIVDAKIIWLHAYIKWAAQVCSFAMESCNTQQEMLEWLRNPESRQKCLDKTVGILDNFKSL